MDPRRPKRRCGDAIAELVIGLYSRVRPVMTGPIRAVTRLPSVPLIKFEERHYRRVDADPQLRWGAPNLH